MGEQELVTPQAQKGGFVICLQFLFFFNLFSTARKVFSMKNSSSEKPLSRAFPIWRPSSLEKQRGEILSMRAKGASLSEIQAYLKSVRINVARSTILRWLRKVDGEKS